MSRLPQNAPVLLQEREKKVRQSSNVSVFAFSHLWFLFCPIAPASRLHRLQPVLTFLSVLDYCDELASYAHPLFVDHVSTHTHTLSLAIALFFLSPLSPLSLSVSLFFL